MKSRYQWGGLQIEAQRISEKGLGVQGVDKDPGLKDQGEGLGSKSASSEILSKAGIRQIGREKTGRN